MLVLFRLCLPCFRFLFFFFNDTATTEIYTLSLHDALPISSRARRRGSRAPTRPGACRAPRDGGSRWAVLDKLRDRKSTRLNSSHLVISYAVFCLKKKKKRYETHTPKSKTDSYHRRQHGPHC